MDPIIQMMLQGYIDGLDTLKTSDEAILQEIEDLKKEMTAFGESQNDSSTFFTNFQNAGLMGKYMDLSTKVNLAAQAAEAPSENKQERHIPTPSEWLEPFRTAFDYIKNYPIRERGLAVYRKLFEIGDRHTNVTEFLSEVERENLLWKISSEDTLGILDITLTGMDPLYKGLTYSTLRNIEAWKASICEADAYYQQDLFAEDNVKYPARLLQPEHYVICLGAHLIAYRGPQGKERIMEMIATGNCPRPEFMSRASGMVILKQQARRTLDIIKRSLGLTFDDIISDEFLKWKLISTSNVYGLSRAYIQSNPNILDILADTVYNEIIPDISLVDSIKREASLNFGRWRMPEDPEYKKAEEIARQTYQHLPYFQYEDQLNNGSIHVGTGEGFDIKPLAGTSSR